MQKDGSIITDGTRKNGLLNLDSRDSHAEVYEWVRTFATALVVAVVLFGFIFRVVYVDGISMVPTLHDKDRVLITGVLYQPQQFDIVIIKSPPNAPRNGKAKNPLVKRVIAVGGQTIDINFDTGTVTVDGVVLSEPYINEVTKNKGTWHYEFPYTVPEGCIFLMGDNRNDSLDSRYFGPIKNSEVIGKVLLRVWPIKDFGTFGSKAAD